MRNLMGMALAALVVATPAWAVDLEHLWTLEGFNNPESIVLGPDGETLYITNVAGEAAEADGEGFISRVSLTGQLLERQWSAGLNAPKGIASDGDSLFVSDIDALVQIDLVSGEIIQRLPIPGAAFLNDVAIAPDGAVLISDSAGARIYRVEGNDISIHAEGDWLSGANGLLFEGATLLISTMGTSALFALDAPAAAPRQISGDLGNGDGIAVLGNGQYLVSEWPGRLFLVASGDDPQTLIDTRDEEIYFNDFLLIGDVLLIPNWQPSTLTAYRVVR